MDKDHTSIPGTSNRRRFSFMRRIGNFIKYLMIFGVLLRSIHAVYFIIKVTICELLGRPCFHKVRASKNPILNMSAIELSKKIRCRKLTSRKVVQASIDRIREVNPIINAVVGENYEEALRQAQKIDDILSGDPSNIPHEYHQDIAPFLGVPCSIKMCMFMKGMPNDVGLIKREGRVSTIDCDVVKKLKEAGAIPLVVTNTSELCTYWETNNKIHGYTRNPYNSAHIVGGSSGGEGALVASQGTPFGIGTDGGGSTRMPAFFNGVYGHKSNGNVVSNDGQFPRMTEFSYYISTGPICRYAEDLGPVMKCIAKIPFKDCSQVDISNLKVHYVMDPKAKFTVSIDKQLLQCMSDLLPILHSKFGLSVQEYQNSIFKYCLPIWTGTFSNGGEMVKFDSQLKFNDPSYVKVNLKWELFKWLFGRSDFTLFTIILALAERKKTPDSLSSFSSTLMELGKKLKFELEDLLKDDGVLLFPSHPTTAPRHGLTHIMPCNFCYTAIFNATGMPVTQIPLGLSRDGLPLGIQIVAKEGNDHLTIALAEKIEKIRGGWVPPQL